MYWTLCLLCTLILMTSTRCHQHAPTYHQYGQTETNHDRLDRTRWSKRDQSTQRTNEWDSQVTQRISERDGKSAKTSDHEQATHLSDLQATLLHDRDGEATQLSELHTLLSDNDQAVQRMSERSLPLHSGRPRLQEVQKRRFNQDEGPRVVNVNKNAGIHSTPRRGVLPDPAISPDVVVFPGPTRRATQFVPSVPEECLRTGICEEVPDYPEERVAAIIEQLGNATDKYKVDELDTPEIAQRIGPPEEMELCDFSLKIVVPKAAPDKNGKWHYILNQKDKPLQGFHVEICKQADSRCSDVAHFYSGYEARCKQKYMLRFMAGLDANGEVVEKHFKLPNCCSCVVRETN